MKLGKYKEAIHEFNNYIMDLESEVDEEYINIYAFVQKGRCLMVQKKYKESIQSFFRAIHNYTECPEAYYFIGLSYIKLGKKEKACKNFNIALKMVNNGYKSSDIYVELFHKIYPQQIKESIKKNCLK